MKFFDTFGQFIISQKIEKFELLFTLYFEGLYVTINNKNAQVSKKSLGFEKVNTQEN